MATLRTHIEVDTSAFRREAHAFVDRVVAPAFVDTINAAAIEAKKALVQAMPQYMDRPTPFTLDAIGVLPATPTAREPGALVYVKGQQARYMTYEIDGGTRGPGDYGSTPEGPIVPGPDAALDAYGNLPESYLSQQEAMGAVWVTLKPGEPPALIRDVGGRTEYLAFIVHELTYDPPRFPFYDVLASAVVQALPDAWGKALPARTGK